MAILRHYHDRLKPDLAQPYHLDPATDDAVFVTQLGAVKPGLDLVALSNSLGAMSRDLVTEVEPIRLAKEAHEWTGKAG